MMIEFPRKLWDELEDEFELRSDYSGRAMYDDTCIGITGSISDLLRFIARTATWNLGGDNYEDEVPSEELIDELARRVRSDSMGYDTIFYFPKMKLASED